MATLKALILPLLIFLAVFVTHSRSSVITSFDSMWSIYIAHSLVHERNINLDEFKPQIKEQKRYGIRKKNGHLYNYFPPGTAFVAVPFIYVFELAPEFWIRILPGFDRARNQLQSAPQLVPTVLDLHLVMERCIASAIMGLTALLMFLIARQYLTTISALFLIFVFSFCTSAWSTASRGLWQHGPSMLALTLALYLILRAKADERIVQLAAIPLALSFVIRPTNSVSIALFTIYVAYAHRKYFFHFAALGLLTISPFVLGSLEVYDRIMPSYFQAQRLGIHSQMLNALSANLFSPARGLFVYSPILLLGLIGVIWRWKKVGVDALHLTILGIIILHTLVVSSFPSWDGGHCYGPRYMSEMIPYLVFFMTSALQVFSKMNGARKALCSLIITMLTLGSFYIHYQGAMRIAVYGWNVQPNEITRHPERIWDWNDPQFLR